MQFILLMKWFETRLKFKNLKKDVSLNNFLPTEIENVWVPELTFANTEERPSTVVDKKTSIAVYKIGKVNLDSIIPNFKPFIFVGGFKLSETFENENIQYFSGKENYLFMRRFYNQRFLCDYQLNWYPFDIQNCFMRMEIKKSNSPFIQLLVDQYKYTGPQFLTQYEVISITMEIRENNKGIQEVFVTISLGRQLLGVILNIIIPTIVLLIISYSTNFYKDDYFESVVAINLTTMLVIVTLFVSVCIYNKGNSV